jgi:hypothetical protein
VPKGTYMAVDAAAQQIAQELDPDDELSS